MADNEGPIGVGLVGAGVAARMHAQALCRASAARLVAVADVDLARARAFAAEWGIARVYGDVEGLLADPAVAAVHVVTPPYLREPITRACAAAGKHVLVEKPMARNLAEADAMIRICRAAQVRLAVVFNHRFMPLPRRLKDGLANGLLGRVFLAEGHVKWWRPPAYYGGSDWRGREDKEGGGALINQGIHTVDLMRWLLGPASEVQGYLARGVHAIECEDTAIASVRFAGGAVATLAASTAAYPGSSERLEIYGSEGSAVLAESDGVLHWRLRDGREWQERHDGTGEASLDGHVHQFDDLAAAIRERRAPAVDGVVGRQALEIVRAVYLSDRRGGPVALPLAE